MKTKLSTFFSNTPNDQLIGSAVGATLGVGTLDESITDSPFSNLAAAGIGAAAGFYTSSNIGGDFETALESRKKDLADNIFSRRIKSASSNLGTDQFTSHVRDSLYRHMGKPNSDKANAFKSNLISSYKTMFGPEIDRYDDIEDMLKLGSFREKENLYKAIQASTGSAESVSIMSNYKPTNKSTQVGMRNKGTLESYLRNVLGHSQDLAERKAGILWDTLSGLGEMSISYDKLIVRNGKEEKVLPLTRHIGAGGDIVRIGTEGSINKVVRPFNPYGEMYTQGRASFGGVTSAYDPEEYLKFMADQDKPLTMSDIDKAKKKTQGLYQFLSDKSYDPIGIEEEYISNGRAYAISNSIDYGAAVFDSKGEYLKGSLDDFGGLLTKLSQDAAEVNPEYATKLRAGLSVNSRDVVRNIRSSVPLEWSYMPAYERGEGATNIREWLPMEGNNSRWLEERMKYMPEQYQKELGRLQRHSSMATRMHADDTFFRMFSRANGADWITTGEGAHIMNEAASAKASAKGKFGMKIMQLKDGSYMFKDSSEMSSLLDKDRLDSILAMENAERRKMIQELGINLGANQNVGIGPGYEMQSVRPHFTSATLLDIRKNQKNELELIFEGVNRPESSAKVFGTASKGTVTMANDKTFRVMAMTRYLQEKGAIDLVEEGKTYNVDPRKFIDTDMKLMDRFTAAEDMVLIDNKFRGFHLGLEENLAGKGSPSMDTFRKAMMEIVGIMDEGEEYRPYNKKTSRLLEEAYKYAKNVDILSEYDDIGFDEVKNISRMPRNQRVQSMMDLIKRPGKLGEDLMVTTMERIGRLADEGNMVAQDVLRKYSTVVNPRDAADEDLRKAVAMVWRRDEDFLSANTFITPDPGKSIYGSGNRAPFSWMQRSALEMSGMSPSEVDAFIERSYADQQELHNITRSAYDGDFSFKGSFNIPSEGNKFINKLFETAPEDRASLLRSAGIEGSTYQLSQKVLGTSSIPIGLETTPYTGSKYVGDDLKMSNLDRLRRDIILADYNLSQGINPTSSKRIVEERVGEMIKHYKSMMGGDNNLLKNATKGRAKYGYMGYAKPFSGNLGKKIDSMSSGPAIVISEDRARGILGDNLSEYMDENGKLRTQAFVTREPAQGPMSSIVSDVWVSKNLPRDAASDVYVTDKAREFFRLNQTDFDADQLYVNMAVTEEQQKILNKHKGRINGLMYDLMDISTAASPKGTKQDVMLDLFKDKSGKIDYGELSKFTTGQYVKALTRKEGASGITKMVMDMQDAVTRNMQSGKIGLDESIKARHALYLLTENLLKTSHAKTEDVIAGKIAGFKALEERDNFLRRAWDDPTSKAYKEAADHYRKQMRSILENTLTGKLDSLAGDRRASAESNIASAIDNIIDSDIEYGKQIRQSGDSLLATNERISGVKTTDELARLISNVGSSSTTSYGIDDMVEQVQTASKADKAAATGKAYLGAITDTVKQRGAVIGAAGLGIAALAVYNSASPVENTGEVSSRALPRKPSDSDANPPAMKDRKAYTRTAREGFDVTVNGSASRHRLGEHSFSDLFSDNTNVNLNIYDKSKFFDSL